MKQTFKRRQETSGKASASRLSQRLVAFVSWKFPVWGFIQVTLLLG